MNLSKTLIVALACLPFAMGTVSCSDDDDGINTEYKGWYDNNMQWLKEMENRVNVDGSAYYKKVLAPWDQNSYVLMHYFENPAENSGNLTPLYTSTVDVRYHVALYDGTPVDSSDNITSPIKGCFRTQLSDPGLISGWKIAIGNMHVGDTCEVIIPFNQAYGYTGSGAIKPYSNLKFNLRLVDIPFYETRP